MARSLCRVWGDYLMPVARGTKCKKCLLLPLALQVPQTGGSSSLGCEYTVGKTWVHMHGSIQSAQSRGSAPNMNSSCSDISESYQHPHPGPFWCPVFHDPAKRDLCRTVRAISYQISSLELVPSLVDLGQTHPRLKFQSSSEYLLGFLYRGEGQTESWK